MRWGRAAERCKRKVALRRKRKPKNRTLFCWGLHRRSARSRLHMKRTHNHTRAGYYKFVHLYTCRANSHMYTRSAHLPPPMHLPRRGIQRIIEEIKPYKDRAM